MEFKKNIIRNVKGILNKLPYIKTLYEQSLNCIHPNGHFYSPVFLIDDVKKRELEIWKNEFKDGILGINLRTEEQKALVLELTKYYNDFSSKSDTQDTLRYELKNDYYSFTDGVLLYSMIRHFKPKRIIEIGSGFSSMVMLDTNELFFNNDIELTFIDPYPERLYSLITEIDKAQTTIIECDVQQISLDVFEKLQAGDILFIDSTHVSKTGSDVNYILFEILPILKKGVFIHFHDVFYPFEYPKKWIFRGINWNEDYILKAFLMYNEKYEIKLFSDYLYKLHKECFCDMPICYNNKGCTLWIEKK